MRFEELNALLANDSGVFICSKIVEPEIKRTIPVRHKAEPGLNDEQVKQLKSKLGHVVGLVDFFQSYGNVQLYQDPISGDTAYYVASPEEWGSLRKEFDSWIEDQDPENADLLPSWIENCCVVGERPGTGNYFLLSTDQDNNGRVFEFEHDGFNFNQISTEFPSFIDFLVGLDEDRLQTIASSLRFVDHGSPMEQWYISEYKDKNISIPLDLKGLGYRLRIFITENCFTSREKRTEVAKFNMPPPDCYGCSTIEHTEITLPNDRVIVLVCEMNETSSSLSVSDPGEHILNSARIGGKSWFSVHSESGFSLNYTLDESTEMFFELAE